MIKNIFHFLNEVRKHWGSLVTSGSIIGGLSIWQGTGHTVWHSAYWVVGIVGFAVASFETWNEERDIAETYRAALQQETDGVLNVRKAIYKEMFFLYANIRSFKNALPESNEYYARALINYVKAMKTDAYRSAKSRPETFFKLHEAYKIEGIYTHLSVAQQMEHFNPQAAPDTVDLFIKKVEEAVRDPAFDLKLFQLITAETKLAFAQEIANKQNNSSS